VLRSYGIDDAVAKVAHDNPKHITNRDFAGRWVRGSADPVPVLYGQGRRGKDQPRLRYGDPLGRRGQADLARQYGSRLEP
jgi:hypothetical protein